MTSFDTNILVYAANADAPENRAAMAFLRGLRDDTVVSELVLVEYYGLLRNPALHRAPLDAASAVERVQRFRRHPRWRVVDHDRAVMEEVWWEAARPGFGRRRIYDVRLALGLRLHGVTRFATRNVRDFEGLGFAEVFDPLG